MAVKTAGKVYLRSRNDSDFNRYYPAVVQALGALPDETVINSEIAALEESGTPTFHAAQHPGSAKSAIFYYVFDVLILSGRNVMSEPLSERRAFLSRHVLANLEEPIRHSPALKASLSDLIKSVGAQGLEGLVAKRLDSPYEPASARALNRRCGSIRHRSS